VTLLDEQLGGKYEVLEKVRVGGMGAIYKVRHRLLDEIRVVKVIRRPGVEGSPAVPAANAQESSPPVKPEESPARVSALPRKPPPRMEPGNMILRSFPGVQEPEVKQLASYSYPAAAKGSGKRLSLRVAVLVDENGQVIDARIRQGKPSGLGFEEVAPAAARKAQFFPATRDGIAGKMWTELVLELAE
jgi:TonB family protein